MICKKCGIKIDSNLGEYCSIECLIGYRQQSLFTINQLKLLAEMTLDRSKTVINRTNNFVDLIHQIEYLEQGLKSLKTLIPGNERYDNGYDKNRI
jgi:hypothetical protein